MKTLILSLLGVTFWTFTALAEVPQGYFSGKYISSNSNARVFVRTVVTKARFNNPKGGKPIIRKIKTNYGLIIRPRDNTGSLFRIEELEDGTQAWVEIFQSRDYLPSVDINQEATYSGQVIAKGKKTHLRLTPTRFGRSLGCGDIIDATRSGALSWEATPKKYLEAKGRGGAKVGVWPNRLSGTFTLDGNTYSGDFSLEPLFTGIGILRAQTLDSESASGKSLEKEITAIVAVIKHQDTKYVFWDDDFQELRLIRLKPGVESCSFPSISLNND